MFLKPFLLASQLERYFCFVMHPYSCYKACQDIDECKGYVVSIHPCSDNFQCYLKSIAIEDVPEERIVPFDKINSIYRIYGTRDCTGVLPENKPFWIWPIFREDDQKCFEGQDRYPNGTLHTPSYGRPYGYNVDALNKEARAREKKKAKIRFTFVAIPNPQYRYANGTLHAPSYGRP